MQTQITLDSLHDRWQALLAADPRLRIRNAARELNVSECELLATRQGRGVTPLATDGRTLLEAAPRLGRVMALTRNDGVVHERHGVYDHIEINGQMGVVLNHEIDLRVFLMHWKHFFAVSEPTRDGDRRSFQVFDAHGEAVHKIYLTEHSDVGAFDAIVAELAAPEAVTPSIVREIPVASTNDDAVNVEAFQAEWRALEDTHHFFGLLRRHNVSRTGALRRAPEGLAVRVANDAYRPVLEGAVANEVPIMCFVGNRGCIQIHSGTVKRLVTTGPWFNVLDPDFNLHLDETRVAETWIVRKPTVDGIVTSLELFDAEGRDLAMFFGERKPGKPELEGWRELIAALPALD